jgi:hypothetical protein
VGRRRQHGVYGRTPDEEGHVLQFTMIATIVLIPTVAVLVWRLIADSRRYENTRLHEELNASVTSGTRLGPSVTPPWQPRNANATGGSPPSRPCGSWQAPQRR